MAENENRQFTGKAPAGSVSERTERPGGTRELPSGILGAPLSLDPHAERQRPACRPRRAPS
jgi:hypothetical protein